MLKNVVRVGFVAVAAAGTLMIAGPSNVSAAPTISTFPDGAVQFTPAGDEWWTCVAGSLAAPYFSIKLPKQGPALDFARFTPGIDVGVACAGTGGSVGFAKIVRPGK